jgi:hypothetical protein
VVGVGGCDVPLSAVLRGFWLPSFSLQIFINQTTHTTNLSEGLRIFVATLL